MKTKFTAAVRANPAADIKWYKDGIEIFVDGEKYLPSNVDGE